MTSKSNCVQGMLELRGTQKHLGSSKHCHAVGRKITKDNFRPRQMRHLEEFGCLLISNVSDKSVMPPQSAFFYHPRKDFGQRSNSGQNEIAYLSALLFWEKCDTTTTPSPSEGK